MKTVGKIALGIILASVLLIGGCVALLGGAANEVSKELDKDQAEHAITQEEFDALEKGQSLDAVIEKLGEPDDTQTTEAGRFKNTLIYYNVEGGEFGDMFQISFNGKEKLDGKSRY